MEPSVCRLSRAQQSLLCPRSQGPLIPSVALADPESCGEEVHMSLQAWQCLAATGIEAEVTTEEGDSSGSKGTLAVTLRGILMAVSTRIEPTPQTLSLVFRNSHPPT